MTDFLASAIISVLTSGWWGWVMFCGLIILLIALAMGSYLAGILGAIVMGFAIRQAIHNAEP